jgi:hypothetical protein
MSKRNGDRARFQRETKKKMLRRERSQELREALKGKGAEASGPGEFGTGLFADGRERRAA